MKNSQINSLFISLFIIVSLIALFVIGVKILIETEKPCHSGMEVITVKPLVWECKS